MLACEQDCLPKDYQGTGGRHGTVSALTPCPSRSQFLPTKPTMSARNHTQQHGQYKQVQDLAMESLLDRLGASTCRCRDWAKEKERTTAFIDWINDVRCNSTWPPWLVPKLTAAINRGLQDDILGVSGPDPANSFICRPSTPGSRKKIWVVVDACASMCQLGASLGWLCNHAALENASPALKVAVKHEIFQQGE